MKKHSKKKANQQFFEQIGDNKINPTLVHFKISPAIKAKYKTKWRMIKRFMNMIIHLNQNYH